MQGKLFNTKPTEYDLPKNLWGLIDHLRSKQKWSDKDVNDYWIPRLKKFCEIEDKWQRIFLDPLDTIKTAARNKDFTSSSALRLEREANKAESTLSTEAAVRSFHVWLKDNIGKDSWDFRKIIYYRRKVLALSNNFKSQWIFGDWRDYLEEVENGSCRLLLIDPPYGMDYQSDRRTDRRKERKHNKIENDNIDTALIEMRDSIRATLPKLNDNAHVLCFCHWKVEHLVIEIMEGLGLAVRGSLIWYKNNAGMGDPFTTFAPQHERIIHAVKGSPILFNRKPDVFEANKVRTTYHPTEKPVSLLKDLIECTTTEGELVMDMFGGVASTHFAAKQCGRAYWGTEKVEKFYRRGKERLAKCSKQETIW
jgi:site-specific DNA-methyltransferase (adenine-specific)